MPTFCKPYTRKDVIHFLVLCTAALAGASLVYAKLKAEQRVELTQSMLIATVRQFHVMELIGYQPHHDDEPLQGLLRAQSPSVYVPPGEEGVQSATAAGELRYRLTGEANHGHPQLRMVFTTNDVTLCRDLATAALHYRATGRNPKVSLGYDHPFWGAGLQLNTLGCVPTTGRYQMVFTLPAGSWRHHEREHA